MAGGDEKEVQSLVAQLEGLNMKNLIAKAVGSTEPSSAEVLRDEKMAKRNEREQSEALKREQERKANVEAALQRLRAERAERQEQRKQLHVRQPQPKQQSRYVSQSKTKNPIPSWNNQKARPPDLAKLRQNEIMKSAAQRREREKEDEKRKERARQREIEERNKKAKEDKKKRMAVLEARKKRQQEELEEWEKQQHILADEESRRRKLAVAAENARRKQDEEDHKKKVAERERRRAAFEQLRRDKEKLDRAAAEKERQQQADTDTEEKQRQQEESLKSRTDGGITPREAGRSEAKFDDDKINYNDETKAARRDEEPPESPIGELPVVYSSLESTMTTNNNLSATSNSKSSFSGTGAAKALIKDPFARAESEVRAKAALQKAKHASENVIGALNNINNRFDDNEGGAIGGRNDGPVERVAYSSSEDDFGDSDSDNSDVDMMLMKRENAGYDSSDDEEEDATLQKRAEQLENELTMATQRVEELKQTLEASKQATQQAIKQGILTPVKSRPVVRNIFAEVEEGEEEDYDDDGGEGYDQVGRLGGGYYGVDDDDDDDEEDDDDLEDSLEESYENDVGYDDDDTFAIRRAEAKLGLNDDEGVGGGERAEAKSLYHRRAEQMVEAKNGTGGGHIVTPRVFIDKDGFESPRDEAKEANGQGGEEGDEDSYVGLSDAVSPSARIEDRVQGLRHRCEQGLGKKVFDEAYEFLKRLQERGGVNGNIVPGGDVTMTPGGTVEGGYDEDEDDEEAVLEELTKILGEDKLHFWSLVDQLLFCEDLRREK